MTPDISEHAFEEEIESALLRHGPDAPRGNAKSVRESPPAYGDDPLPGGYRKRRPEDYDRGLCLLPTDVVDFLLRAEVADAREGPKTQIVDGRTVCLVSCQRSPEPVYLRWKGLEKTNGGDLHVRTGPASVRLAGEDAAKYVATRFGTPQILRTTGRAPPAGSWPGSATARSP